MSKLTHVQAPPDFGCPFCNKPEAKWCPMHGYRLEIVRNPEPCEPSHQGVSGDASEKDR